ncbi:MAG: hypothetical protein A3J93_04710 [Candidatus Magasanikbacteria bacterium RIFOXYC2_FULL_42_28]|uniref:Nucleotidyl transferase AbiEii/AbiGii toxin family protein n=1 Tax=Candidatus Magasanikbacteria bacterium RIFOXYC2_FULL_42_28 TaxID=1798704 RepID=A0A1F6NWM4_9BACT|nr:MAG: hypothetical protein A3J93_04710 [Candidatus Magasanikbacteria bacterium RIFOXYC2_FULL_42_28]
MHPEILSEEQRQLLPLVGKFTKKFGLVGGTAIALQIGHRQSIDFDLFSLEKFDNAKIRKAITKSRRKIKTVYKDEDGQFTFFIGQVQLTFFQYPFKIDYSKNFDKLLRFPDLLTLAAMKAYALGRRAKWKDYVDLYFIIRDHHSVVEITKAGKAIFGGEFNGRIFREQLAYFNDINYSEKVYFLPGYEVSEQKIKKALQEYSVAENLA